MLVVEDGAPAHTSQVAEAAQNCLGICSLTHPPNSPDLNPIEPPWKLLKTHMGHRWGAHESLDALWQAG